MRLPCRFDPVCNDSIIWHFHLQKGYEADTIQFVFNKDTFPDNSLGTPWVVATSDKNGCTGIYFTCYRYNSQIEIFLKNMPLFNEVQQSNEIDRKNIKVSVLVNGNAFDLDIPLNDTRFFGLNYDSKQRGLLVLSGKSCFVCQ
jgi:hypothetical protein